MRNTLSLRILRYLKAYGVKFKVIKHKPVITSVETAKARGVKLSECVKAIILRDKKNDENIMFCLPGGEKIDFKMLRNVTGRRYEFEKAEKIKERFKIEIGGVPPFGNLLNIKTYFSKNVLKSRRVNFNIGTRSLSVSMESCDLAKVVKPILL